MSLLLMLLSFVVKEEVGEVHQLLVGRAKCFCGTK